MAEQIVMPRLGWTMEEGTLVEWLKEAGDTVAAGEIVLAVESDKALNEVESFASGVLHIPANAPQPGATVPVGTVLGYLLQPGEEPPAEEAPVAAPVPAAEMVPAASAVPAPPEAVAAGAPLETGSRSSAATPAISPRARRVAGELGLAWEQLQGSGRTGRIIERDVRAAAQQRPAKSTPLAQRLAAASGIDLAEVAAQKGGGRIGRQDVEAAQADRIRRLVAGHVADSARTTAAVTLTTEADATELVDLRAKFKASLGGEAPTYNDLMIKLTALALVRHAPLNAWWQDGQLDLHDTVHMGLAVDTEDGLLVPVLRDAQALSLQQIRGQTLDLAARARSRQLNPDDLQGGTFTLTNLGMYNIDTFTPIIHLPQCAILGVGRIVEKAAVHQGQVVPRWLLALSLTFDHRALDGGPAARFLDEVRGYVEQPFLWLSRL